MPNPNPSPATRFKPGNPYAVIGSRAAVEKRKKPVTEHLKRLLDEGENARIFAERLLVAALKGNTKAIREILDRVEGRVPLPVTGPDGGPIPHDHEHRHDVTLRNLSDADLDLIDRITEGVGEG